MPRSNSSPLRAARDEEESASLLPQNGDTSTARARNGNARGVLKRYLNFWGDGEDEDGLPASSIAKRRSPPQYWRWAVYVMLLLVGVLLGWVITGRGMKRSKGNKNGGFLENPIEHYLPPPTGLPRNQAYLANGTQGAVASEEVTCSNLGLGILRDHNGTAVDAAVTTTLCIGLLNAFSSGIGGGGFMVVRVPDDSPLPGDREKEAGVWAIDFRETSPEKSDKWMYGANKAGRVGAQQGGLAVGVPGELRGLEMAHKLYGTLPWKELVMPVAELAKGYYVSRELAKRIRIFGSLFMMNFPTWKEVYAPQGYLAVEGDYIKRVNYGKTLEKVAEHGASYFYEGELAKQTVETLRKTGGIMTEDDLRNYQARRYPAIHQTYHDKTIFTTSAPSSGGVMLGLLNLLERYNLQESGCLDSNLNTHRFVEALKFAFGARSEVCDPSFAENPALFDHFYSKEWANATRPKLTDDKTHDPDYYGIKYDTPVDKGTTHLSVVDKWGGAASVTSTVNGIWGSGVMDPETGIIFNNEQDDFAVPGAPDQFGLQPSPYNYPAAGKKPLSSTAATIMLNADGTLHAVLGGSGGSRIFGGIAQVILNLQCGYNISGAIERPRIHDQVVPKLTDIEVGPEGDDIELIESLKAKGHNMWEWDVNAARAEIQGILLDSGYIWASSDSRKNGVAAAY